MPRGTIDDGGELEQEEGAGTGTGEEGEGKSDEHFWLPEWWRPILLGSPVVPRGRVKLRVGGETLEMLRASI
jgi:hypothetical protein